MALAPLRRSFIVGSPLKIAFFSATRYYMAFWQKVPHRLLREGFHYTLLRVYSSRIDWKQLRPMILKRINARAKNYPVQSMIPVAYDVLKAREMLIEGVFTLMKVVPIKSCKFCPEVYIGESGHQIKTCHGFKRIVKNQVHRWTDGNVNDILVPVEAFHLETMSQRIIKHDRRFDFDRVPSVLELCSQAGAEIPDNILYDNKILDNNKVSPSLSENTENISSIAQRTLEAWENLRLGVKKLLLVYPAKVCEYCSEVHIGPSGHKARMCGVFKFESWRGSHLWKRAEVDDLVPPKVVWRRRPQDPSVLLDSGRGFYGHAPAVVELCSQAGARIPTKYFCMMKLHGLTAITPS